MDDALDRALEVFWAQGYHHASLTDLLSAMNLSKSSFYGTFGSKHDVLMAALARYSDLGIGKYRALFTSGGDVIALIREFLTRSLDDGDPLCRVRGCAMVNISIELAPIDPGIEALVQTHNQRLRALVEDALSRGVAQGTVRTGLDVPAWCRTLMVFLSGLYVHRWGGADPDALNAAIETLVAQLRPSPT
jgi:TetR/AcrR family transcriptional repressor of nem operon